MKSIFTLIAAAGLLATAPAFADINLAKAKNCMACHAVSDKVVGPSYQAVAAKYATTSNAVEMLAKKIIRGSSGVWGAVPMPPNNVTDAEAKELAAWIMSLK